MTLNYPVPSGQIKFVCYVSPNLAIVANCATIAHRPDEIERLDPLNPTIPYDWAIRHG